MKRRRKPRVGDLVRIVFLDHCTGAGDEKGVLTFECYGRLSSEDRIHYNVCHWGYLPEDHQQPDHNCEYHHIVKSAVIEIRRLA